jgi:hypothetical protein
MRWRVCREATIKPFPNHTTAIHVCGFVTPVCDAAQARHIVKRKQYQADRLFHSRIGGFLDPLVNHAKSACRQTRGIMVAIPSSSIDVSSVIR